MTIMLRSIVAAVAGTALLFLASTAGAVVDFGPLGALESGGAEIQVYGNAVPATCDWNEDGRQDLIAGEGGLFDGKVRVYLNTGTSQAPLFDGFFYAQTTEGDLAHDPSG